MTNSGIFPLAGESNEYPLVAARVQYRVLDVQLLANITQTYVSNASQDAEICYVFPLPPDASVCSFKAVLDGSRTIKGVVKEKRLADAEYKEAVSRGKTAALIKQKNVETFQVSLGNIKPKQNIDIHICFVSLVSHDGSFDSLRLTFPTVIAPRYGTPPGYDHGDSHPNAKSFELTVAVEMSSKVKSISSPSHPITATLGTYSVEKTTAFNPRHAHVNFSSPTFLEKDVVLVLSCEDLDRPRCTVESFSLEEGSQEHTDAYALTLVPRFDLPALPRQEYIFLVDRSGSMEGGKITGVRKALQIMLRSLPSRDTTFNIISFGSSATSLWPASVHYSSSSVTEASIHVDSMQANFGGTELRAAFKTAFASTNKKTEDAPKSVPTAIFVLTDGEAWDLNGVQDIIRGQVKKSNVDEGLLRVFCLGIGNAVSKAMCDGIVRAGQGTAVFVGENEKPDHKLMELLKAARGAIVEGLSVDWGVGENREETLEDFEIVPGPATQPASELHNAPAPIHLFNDTAMSSGSPELGPKYIPITLPPTPRIQQAPDFGSLPPIYPGFRISVFAIVKHDGGENTSRSKTVRIKGSVLGGSVSLEVPVFPENTVTHGDPENLTPKVLHTLAARALIQNMEGGPPGAKSEGVKAEIVRLATRYGLASSQTSFIAVDKGGAELTAFKSEAVVTKVDPPKLSRISPPGRWGAKRQRTVFVANPHESSNEDEDEDDADEAELGNFDYAGALAALASSPSASAPLDARLSRLGCSANIARLKHNAPIASPIPPSSDGYSYDNTGAPEAPDTSDHLSTSIWSPPSLDEIARVQAFDGSFPYCSVLFDPKSDNVTTAMDKLPGTLFAGLQGGGSGVKRILWSTALCLSWLERHFKVEEDVWSMIAEKSRTYMNDTVSVALQASEQGVEDFVKKLLAEAKGCLDALPEESGQQQ